MVSPAIRDAFSGGGQRPASHGVAPLPSSNGAAFDVELQQRLARKAETNAADEGARSPVLEKQAVASAPQVPPARAKLLDSGVTQYDSRAPSLNSSLVNAGASGPDDDALETDDPYGRKRFVAFVRRTTKHYHCMQALFLGECRPNSHRPNKTLNWTSWTMHSKVNQLILSTLFVHVASSSMVQIWLLI